MNALLCIRCEIQNAAVWDQWAAWMLCVYCVCVCVRVCRVQSFVQTEWLNLKVTTQRAKTRTFKKKSNRTDGGLKKTQTRWREKNPQKTVELLQTAKSPRWDGLKAPVDVSSSFSKCRRFVSEEFPENDVGAGNVTQASYILSTGALWCAD